MPETQNNDAPAPKEPNEKKQMIIMIIIMVVLIVGTSIHYYIYSKRRAEQGKGVGPETDGAKNIMDVIPSAKSDDESAPSSTTQPATPPDETP
jgi:flagellar basal body-associated protein FliL